MRRTNFVVVVGAGLLALALTPGSADATIPPSERDALIDFYISTTGVGWTHRDNWRNVGDTDFEAVGTECTWYGVTCDETEDHVTRISLNSNNLNGPISGSIGNFSALVILELLGNSNLTGPIPASIGNLAALQVLNAYDGGLTGSLPPEIGNLSNLYWLELSTNQLNGAIPPEIGDLTSLTELDLHANQLSGAIPPEIGDLSSLLNLRLAENQLSGSFPPEVGDLTNLRYLRIYSNQLSGPLPPEIGDLTNLLVLDLSENGLTGAIPSEIGNLARLQSLDLSFNNLSGSIPPEIGTLHSLRWMTLTENSFSGVLPPEIGDLTELRNLRLRGNLLIGQFPDEIVKLVNLTDGSGLQLGYNALRTASHAVDAFLDLKHSSSGDWRATQTVAPTEVSIGSVTNTTVELTWTPIDYTGDTGGYTAWLATASGGPYTQFGGTADKNASSITVLGLNPVTPYYFHVDTVTDPHGSNQNTVISQPSPEVATRTFSGGGPTLSIGDATVVEGDSGTVSAVFTVSLYPPSMGPVSVTVATADTTASAGSDYVTASIPLVFAPGETSQTASITVNGDTLVEDDEYFVAFLQSGSGAGVGRNAGSARIMNDDSGLVTHERQALIDLYISTNGAGWKFDTNWRNAGDTDFNIPGTECNWLGVTCDASGQRVRMILLAHNSLSGSLPVSLGDFTALEVLSLEGNNMVGEIPAEVGKMAALTTLELSYAGTLTGSIPPEIGELSELERLYLFDLQLSGPVPPELGLLSKLRILELWANQLTGPIPLQIGDLALLERLDLGFNQLSGAIPPALGDLADLEHLALNSNQFTGIIPPELGQLSKLRRLYLSANEISGSIPTQLGSLSQLNLLLLDRNQITGSIPSEIGDMSNLTILDLEHNMLAGEIPSDIGALPSLSRLELRGNQLSGEIPYELGSLSTLWRLDVGENRLSGEVPPEIGDLSNLNYLQLDSNRLTGSLPAALTGLTSLNNMTGLDLRWNGLHTDEVFLAAFLNTKHANLGDWRDTQTVAPENLIVTSMNDHTVWLSWDVVDYTEDEGGYEIFFAPTGSGSWVSGGWTSDKSVTLFPVTGLVPATIYDLAVVSYTAPHIDNQNWVTSDFSGKEMATTSDMACPEPGIAIDFSAGISLSVPGSFSTYDWSTGESTAAIVVDPPEAQWYWVEVISAGGCIDTAAKWVAPWVFANAFESGDLSGWSSATP